MLMTSTEFCYWLQGAIEIGDLQRVNACQKQKIILALNSIQSHSVFTLGYRMLFEQFDANSVFEDMRQELQSIFIHDIDPTYEGDQEFLHLVHVGAVDETGKPA